jgi:hypothetical protein
MIISHSNHNRLSDSNLTLKWKEQSKLNIFESIGFNGPMTEKAIKS